MSLLKEIINIFKWRARNMLIDPFYIFRWEYLPRLVRKKHSCDSKRKSSKIYVTFLTYKRPKYFEKTLSSFISKNRSILSRLKIFVLIQGKDKDEETERILKRFKKHIHKIIYSRKNLGTAGGYTLLMEKVLQSSSNYIIHIEDDFVSLMSLSEYIDELIDFLETNKNVGYVRLRSFKDNVNAYNVISRRKIRYKPSTKNIAINKSHFTFNPTISKASVIRMIVPTTSEIDAMKKYQQLGLKSGQLFAECFSHIGDERVVDWRR